MSVPSHVSADGHDPLSSSFSASYAGVVAFIAVATEGSFARAGERLGIGRSAVSRSVQRLEGQLGAPVAASADAHEGIRAFNEKRAPQWQGR